MTLGLSLFQLGTATVRTLRDQNWNRMAHVTAEAGVAYAQSCLENASDPTSAWSSDLKPDTDCTGSATAASAYVRDETSTGADRYRTSFAVQPVATGSDNIPKAKTVGTVEVLAATSGTVTKTYTSETTVILSIQGDGSSGDDNNGNDDFPTYGSNDDRICRKKLDNQIWCLKTSNNGNKTIDTKINLPAGISVKQYSFIGYADEQDGLCVIGSNDLVYCDIDGVASTTGAPLGSNLPGGPLKAKALWYGYEDGSGPICVVSLNDEMWCWSSGYITESTIGAGGSGDIFGVSFAKPIQGFNTGTYFGSGELKIKTIIGKATFNQPNNYDTVNRRYRCAIATSVVTGDQLYCSGYCNQYGIYFGTALYGSGQKGCGRGGTSAAYNPSPNVATSGYDIYYSPVKFILPSDVSAKRAILQTVDFSSNGSGPARVKLCVDASDNNRYCTSTQGPATLTEPTPLY